MSFSFLMYSDRSGSNLLKNMIDSHHKICAPYTKQLINPIARNLYRYRDLQNEENWEELLKDINRLYNAKLSDWKTEMSLSKLKSLAPIGEIGTLIKKIYMEEAKNNGKEYVLIKESPMYEFIIFLTQNFKDAKFIYLVRDPRDMALSWKNSPSHFGGVIEGAKRWKKDQLGFLRDYSILYQQKKALKVYYERLLEDTEIELRRICEFLGVEFDIKMLEFYKNDTNKNHASKFKMWENTGNKVMKNNKEKYLKELTESEIRSIETICYPEMNVLGYTPVNSSSELLSEEDLNVLELNERKSVNNFNVKELSEINDVKRSIYTKF